MSDEAAKKHRAPRAPRNSKPLKAEQAVTKIRRLQAEIVQVISVIPESEKPAARAMLGAVGIEIAGL